MQNNQNSSGLSFNGGEPQEENTISIMEILLLFVRYWKWIVAGMTVALIAAFIYLWYATPTYKVTSSIILKEDNSTTQSYAPRNAVEGVSALGSVTNLDNEIYILQSRTTIRSVINQLKLHTSYIVKEDIKKIDLYNKSPVIVDMEQNNLENLRHPIEIKLVMDEASPRVSVSLFIEEEKTDTVFIELPALLCTKAGNISFTRRPGSNPFHKPLNIFICNPNDAIKSYRSALSVQQASQNASVLDVSLNTPYTEKGIDFLNKLVEVYNNNTLQDKNMETTNTQAFIDNRIAIIDRELTTAEKDVEQFKQNQGLTNFSSDLQKNMEMGTRYEQQLVEVETQIKMVDYLDEYVNDEANANKMIPSNIGINDPTLAATTNEYNKLIMERERLAQSTTRDNPMMRKLEEQLAALRTNINASIRSVGQSLNIACRDVRNQATIFGGKVESTPTQERQFMELSREQQIKASLFLMLLEKREENALALAATANKAKVLDEAMVDSKVAPRTMVILSAALFLGLLVPAAIIYLLDLLQYRIHTKTDVDRIAKVPLLAEIPTYEGSIIAVHKNAVHEIDEAFRMLRTNLMPMLGAEKKVMAFTSTVLGEGKTFVAWNTAITLSLLKKKVLLIGLDLRIPHLFEYMNLDSKTGITDYLAGIEENIHTLILPSGVMDNFDVIPTGTIPPDPAELLSQNTLDKAIDTLRNEYDYILIDSAPVGLVADTLILNRVVDTTVYICRSHYSNKNNLRFANQLMSENKLNNMLLVVNDVDYLYRPYGYGYGYGYKKDKKNKYKGRGKNYR
ncbi:MAG TPA: tyrosine protein kinase [Porphyromonadaceae bacterium]|jgi:capsular exopolysaccharide synthesis family protein|uniref:GumC family protein n=1 Tax=Limibacterium fermenti TaxID=3229863 RepID=UPI000E8DDA29|nr:tyrosine protein kinase [Porphyromonadaceae bacterium]HBL33330.1 tyrosine protein kinase [Porphyromonadaceae bacterium]HBX46818.1 tyrosine protein kinase [Porphyromonadaceae bacterium]